MPLKGFTQAINLQCQFLTNYARVFRSNVLASPHWFLQMLADSVTVIIDRLSTGITNDLVALLYVSSEFEHVTNPQVCSTVVAYE